MPYEWLPAPDDATAAQLHLWPHRSLPRRGFVWFIGITVSMVTVPLLAVVGSAVLWGLLPFVAIAVAGVWVALDRSYHTGRLTEVVTLDRDRIHIRHEKPDGRRLEWTANPYWVRVELLSDGGPVEEYLTLKGGDRDVELGSFLSPEERVALAAELRAALRRFR
jgi:uncharacterized membrane protein